MSADVKVGGIRVPAVGDLTYSECLQPTAGDTWGGGGQIWDARWAQANATPNYRHPAYVIGALVHIVEEGGLLVGTGLYNGFDPNSGDHTAIGLCQDAVNYGCFKDDGTGKPIPSTTLDLVVDWAIAQGWQVTRPVSLSSVPLIGTTGKPGQPTPSGVDDTLGMEQFAAGIRTVKDLLDAVARAQGKRWFVDRFGALRMESDRTVPNLSMVPSVPQMAIADDDYVTGAWGLVATSYTSGVVTATVVSEALPGAAGSDPGTTTSTRKRNAVIDLTAKRLLTKGAGDTELATRLGNGKPRYSFTNSLTADPTTLRCGGVPVGPALPQMGDMVTLQSIDDSYGNLAFGLTTDVLINKVTKTKGSPTVVLEPMGKVARDLTSVLADAVADTTADSLI